MISGDTGQTPNEGQTAGSQSVENSGTALRMAGAEVRALLLELAAKRLGVAADQLTVRGRRDLGARWPQDRLSASLPPVSISIARRPPRLRRSRRRATGSWANRSRASIFRPKSRAAPRSSRTCGLPGMLHGRVVRPPRYGSTLDSVDEAPARRMQGVVAVVRDGSFLGVVAEREEQAIKAREALLKSAKWTPGPGAARSGAHFRGDQVAAEQGRDHRRQAGRRARRTPAPSRRSTPSPTWRMPRSGPRARSPSSRTAR